MMVRVGQKRGDRNLPLLLQLMLSIESSKIHAIL